MNGGIGCRKISEDVENSLFKAIKTPYVCVMVLSYPSGVEVTCGLYLSSRSGSPCIGRSRVGGRNMVINTSIIFVVDDQPLRSSRDGLGARGLESAEIFFGRHHRV